MCGEHITGYFSGDTLKLAYQVLTEAGEVVDLTGATLRWSVSTAVSSGSTPTALFTKTIGSGIEVTDAANGRCVVTIAKGNITQIGPLTYNFEVTLSNGESYTAAAGIVSADFAIERI
jgi:hypothetical protein